jgi:hypothetical protein
MWMVRAGENAFLVDDFRRKSHLKKHGTKKGKRLRFSP